MRFIHPVLVLWLPLATVVSVPAQPITVAGRPAQLDIRAAGEHSIRVTLKPIGFAGDFPFTPAVTERSYPASAVSLAADTMTTSNALAGLNGLWQPSARGGVWVRC
jgi:alpha-glucosidase/alpha-D-xyloside xylohydrolase